MKHTAIATANATDESLATLLASASELVLQFPKCFWFWRPDARLMPADDLRLVSLGEGLGYYVGVVPHGEKTMKRAGGAAST